MSTSTVTPTTTFAITPTPATSRNALRKCDPQYVAELTTAFKKVLHATNTLYFLLGRDGDTGFDSEETDAFLTSIATSDDVSAIGDMYDYLNWNTDLADDIWSVHAENNRKAAKARRQAKAMKV